MMLTDQSHGRGAAAPSRTDRICVVGLGKIGLALAAQFVSKGHRVAGADIDEALVQRVQRGEVPPGSEAGLADRVRDGHQAGLLTATTQTHEAVAQSDVVVVIVPLLVDRTGKPAFRALDAATAAVAKGLQPGTLVVYETTLPLGTTRNRFGPALETSGLRVGSDFHLAFSPERVYVGRTFEDLRRYPKVVGGTTPQATDAAVAFYRSVLDAEIMPMPDAETAEFVKLAETTYRDINIAFANELARFGQARGIDAVAAFRAANTQPFSHIHQPGVGVGGHCIPVYPQFLLDQDTDGHLGIARRARQANDGMAAYAVDLLQARRGDVAGARVLILGLAYRGGVKEASFSSALLLVDALRARGAVPLLNDPLFSDDEIRAVGAEPFTLGDETPVDAVILQADHPEYLRLDWRVFRGCRAVVDGRNVLDPREVERAGVTYIGIGRARDGSASPGAEEIHEGEVRRG